MSKTWEIVCHDCRAHLWIGQGDERKYLYKTDEHIAALETFIFEHINHKVEFMSGEQQGAIFDDYEDVEGEEG